MRSKAMIIFMKTCQTDEQMKKTHDLDPRNIGFSMRIDMITLELIGRGKKSYMHT